MNDRRMISWKEAAIWLIAILISLSGFFLNDLHSQVKAIKETKIDRSEFYEIISRSDKKSDLIIQLLRDHEAKNGRGD
jgi:hypothetical protein